MHYAPTAYAGFDIVTCDLHDSKSRMSLLLVLFNIEFKIQVQTHIDRR